MAKTDRIDAAVIARYGAFARPGPTPKATGARQMLADLLAYRRQLTAEITARGQQLGHLATPALRERAAAALARLRAEQQEITLSTPCLRACADQPFGLRRTAGAGSC